MALATAKAAPLRADIKLSQALSDYEAILSAEQRQSYTKSPPDANAVMALTCEIDRQNAGRRTRRCGARLTSFLNSVKGFTSVIDLIVSSSGNPIAGGVWGAVKIAIQVRIFFKAIYPSASGLQPCYFPLNTTLSYIILHRLRQASKPISTRYRHF